MHSQQFNADSSSNGGVERDLIVGEVPDVLWSPPPGVDRAPRAIISVGSPSRESE